MVNYINAIKKLWTDTMTITEYEPYTKPDKSTGYNPVIVAENIQCKLSFQSLSTVSQNDVNAGIQQSVKLFCDKTVQITNLPKNRQIENLSDFSSELVIKAGSKITVQHDGQTFEYKQSGLPGVFAQHQEIVCIPFDEKA